MVIKFNNKKKAFTLVELLVVISIVALLMSIIMPALSKVRIQARETICMSNARTLGQAALLYASNNDDLYPQAKTYEATGRPNKPYKVVKEGPFWVILKRNQY